MSKKKLILIILIALALVVGSVWIFSYLTKSVAVVIKFNSEVSKESAVAVAEKYNLAISQREHIEYENPFFSWLYPYEQKGHKSIAVETSKIRAEILKRQMSREKEVNKVIIMPHAYEEAKYYKSLFESLNPSLSQ